MLVLERVQWCHQRRGVKIALCLRGPLLVADMDPNSAEDPAQTEAALNRLLQRCGNGDRAAFRALYDAQASRLYGLALRITRQPALAADAVHDAFLQAWQRGARFDPARGSASAWLTGLVRYRAIDAMRKRTREVTGLDLPDEPDLTPGALDRLIASTAGQALHHCLSLLDEHQRRAIVLAFTDGLSHAELAQQLAAPLGTVKSWIRRGLAALKGCLEP
jgi:RNA polymerase sigma-70 factor (ECF subfamily)